jgi:hypothetical protein
MSCFDVRLAVLASPDRARSLFTVRHDLLGPLGALAALLGAVLDVLV